MDSIVGPHAHGERPHGLHGKIGLDPREISHKRFKPTIDQSSIKFEQPEMMLHERYGFEYV